MDIRSDQGYDELFNAKLTIRNSHYAIIKSIVPMAKVTRDKVYVVLGDKCNHVKVIVITKIEHDLVTRVKYGCDDNIWERAVYDDWKNMSNSTKKLQIIFAECEVSFYRNLELVDHLTTLIGYSRVAGMYFTSRTFKVLHPKCVC